MAWSARRRSPAISPSGTACQAELRLRTADLECAYPDLETFSYSVSHDLRAPLRALDGLSNALLEDCGHSLSEAGLGYTKRIQAASRANDVAHRGPPEPGARFAGQDHPSSSTWGRRSPTSRRNSSTRDPDRHVRFTIQQPAWATADLTLIRTVLQNLLDNAWKFTSRRDNATIEFGITRRDDSCSRFYVRDNGAGFDPAYAGKLFKPFERLHQPPSSLAPASAWRA